MITALEQQIDLVPEDVRARILLATSYAYFGNKIEAVQQLEKGVAMRPNDPNTLYNAACTYGLLEMKSEALAMLKRAIETGFSDMEWVSRDPDFVCLRGHEEFERLIASKPRS
jgi:Flp pilus assembly protein TadD